MSTPFIWWSGLSCSCEFILRYFELMLRYSHPRTWRDFLVFASKEKIILPCLNQISNFSHFKVPHFIKSKMPSLVKIHHYFRIMEKYCKVNYEKVHISIIRCIPISERFSEGLWSISEKQSMQSLDGTATDWGQLLFISLIFCILIYERNCQV